MSCTSPISITNRTKSFIPGITKSSIVVPCGSCDSCRQQLQDDWAARTWFEIKKFRASGGRSLFMTFTYRNSCLPGIHCDDGSFIPGFSKDDKDTFLNSLRKHFERQGLFGIEYMWCCEFGFNNTCRPHYHVILHFPRSYNRFKTSKLQRIINYYWHYGYVFWSDPNVGGAEIKSDKAATYVSKYCTKDLDFFEQPIVQKWLTGADGQIVSSRLQQYKRFAPRHWQSKSYGSCMVDYVLEHDPVDILINGIDLKKQTDVNSFLRHRVSLPRYVRNKLLYKTLDDGRRTYSVRGKCLMSEIHKALLDHNRQQLVHQLCYTELSRKLFPVDYLDSFFVDRNIHCSDDLYEYLFNLVPYSSSEIIDEMVLFRKVWQGVPCTTSDISYIDSLSYEQFVDKSISNLIDGFSLDIQLVPFYDTGAFSRSPEDRYNTADFDYHLTHKYDHAKRFSNYVECSKVIDRVNNIFSSRKAREKEKQAREYKRTKYLLQNN